MDRVWEHILTVNHCLLTYNGGPETNINESRVGEEPCGNKKKGERGEEKGKDEEKE